MPRITVLQINVHDMDRAIEFYELLGLSVASREHYPQIVKLAHDHVDQMTLLLYRVDRPTKVDYPRESQILFNVETDDLQGALERLRSQGAEVLHETPEACPVGVYGAVRDPSGNVVELIEYRRSD